MKIRHSIYKLQAHVRRQAIAVHTFFPALSRWQALARLDARRESTRWSQEASAQGLAAWAQSAQSAQRANGDSAIFGYGGLVDNALLPLTVQHDRSRPIGLISLWVSGSPYRIQE